jgi:hypothetical protein
MWGTSLLFFKAPNNPTVQNALKFIHKVILTAGTTDEKRQMDFNQPAHPLYYYILKLFLQVSYFPSFHEKFLIYIVSSVSHGRAPVGSTSTDKYCFLNFGELQRY